jgi:F-box interacting protein|uniref:F-box domain-containing protein n=1 Tax=Fagus sylvatica TaxID=28930 RepID=A0A2N9I026_FAGSY
MSDRYVSYDFLPVEIVTNILLRLPTKSLITCICVCKTWKSLIQNPNFISTHLHLSINNNNHHLLFCHRSNNEVVYASALHNDDDFTQHTGFDFPLLGPELKVYVVNTCNGLVCLCDYSSTITNELYFLWNPCVRRLVRLPSPNVTFQTHGDYYASIGFVFDSKTNDYKVVRVVDVFPKYRPLVEVYSLATGEWRMVAALPPICSVVKGLLPPQIFVNKALHWPAYRRSDDSKRHGGFILVFDLGDEVFCEILLPEVPNFCTDSVFVYGNSVAFSQRTSLSLNIWVMKEYGVASSWTKVCTVSNQVLGKGIPFPIGFRRNGEVLYTAYEGQLVVMDLENQKMKDLRIGLDWYEYKFVDSYVESLVLLDKAANVAVTY